MNVCIIGGGASGMMVAILLSQKGCNVTIFEKNAELGKKILITGKGRCNVTNFCSNDEFLANVVRGKKFLISSLQAFPPQKTIDFFESCGVKLKTERGNRVFPLSDSASTIKNALLQKLKQNNVKILTNCSVNAIFAKGKRFIAIESNGTKYTFDACVVATGGLSYKTTGSTGDGYNFASKMGHKIIDLVPALNGIETKQSVKQLEGLALKNVVVKAIDKEKVVYSSEIGEMIFTNVGVSGPIVLSMSSYINRINVDDISIDLKPALSYQQLETRIDMEIEQNNKKTLISLLSTLLPKRLIDEFVIRLEVNRDTKLNQISRAKRQKLVALLKDFRLQFKCVEPIDYAVITSGGVSTDEINPKDMQSKLISGLFFVGEVLDVDALTGGFNLQIAFMTANACANSKFFEEV